MKRICAVLLVAAVAFTGTRSTASADQGVSVSLGRIDVAQRLSPGGHYHLPGVTVTNIGDQAQRYEVVVNYLDDAGRDRPPGGWFGISPSTMELAPRESKAVQLDIDLPAGARPGSYLALIEAHPTHLDDGTRVAAAAATRVSFSVKPATLFDAWRLRMTQMMEDYYPWSYVLPMLGLSVLVLLVLRNRLRVNVRVTRRR